MEREELRKSSEARKTVLKNTEEELARCVDDKTNLMEEARNNSGTNIDELVDKVRGKINKNLYKSQHKR